jgi:hypothetical protein
LADISILSRARSEGSETEIRIRVLAEIVLIEQELFNIKNINMWFLINIHVRTIFILD